MNTYLPLAPAATTSTPTQPLLQQNSHPFLSNSPSSSSSPRTHHSNSISSTSSTNSTQSSTPEQTAFVYIVKEAIQPLQQSTQKYRESDKGVYRKLEDANNKVYAMRLEHETCHPCFFDYGGEENGDSLSWHIPHDGEEGGEDGVRVFVERRDVMIQHGEEQGQVGLVKRDWRAALEPMTRLHEEKWKPFQSR